MGERDKLYCLRIPTGVTQCFPSLSPPFSFLDNTYLFIAIPRMNILSPATANGNVTLYRKSLSREVAASLSDVHTAAQRL